MMKLLIRRAAGSLAFIIYMSIYCLGADIANLQLVVASPDPVQAGTEVLFQIIVVNAGTAIWEAKSYMVEAELYDLQKKYLLKSDRVQGVKKVNPGGRSLLYVSLTIPEYFSGIYYYRIYIIHGTDRIYTGRLTPLRVNPLPILPPKPPTIKLGGNAILSYKSDTSDDWKDFTGNASLNVVGRVVDRSVLFNLYTIHDQDDAVDIYTILLNYYGSWVHLSLGDILPEFNELSMYGTGMRGALWENQSGPFKTTLVGARLVESNEGSSETDGVFRRMLYGGEEQISLPGEFTAAMNILYGADIESSVEIPGPTLKPKKNTAYGGILEWSGLQFLTLKGQYEGSSWAEDTTSTATAVSDSAYRGDIEIETDVWTFSSYFQRTGPDFVSFGAPEANADRVTMDINSELYLFNFWTLSGGYNKFYDDLDDDPYVVRTTQQITSGGTSFNFRSGTGISASYSMNEARGELREIQDNYTGTLSYGLSQSWWGQSLALARQKSEFRDKVNPDSDLDTTTDSININCVLGERFSSSIGVSLTKNKNIVELTEEKNDSYSVSFNQVILKNKLTVQVWGTYIDIVNTNHSEDSQAINGNVEFTYICRSNVSVTVGGSRETFSDKADTSTNKHETGANMRINYSF